MYRKSQNESKKGNYVMKFSYISFFFIIILTTSLSSALLGEFQQGSCVDIKTILNTSSVTLSTVNYPNSSVAIANQSMTKSGSTFNYTFCDTETIGSYNYDYVDAEGNTFVNNFIISRIADTITTGSAIIYIILLFVSLLLLLLFVYVSIKVPYENEGHVDSRGRIVITKVTKNKYVKLVAIWLSFGIFMWFLTIVTGLTNNYIKFEPLIEMTNNLMFWFRSLMFGVNLGIIWTLFYIGWKDIVLNKTVLSEGRAILNSLGR